MRATESWVRSLVLGTVVALAAAPQGGAAPLEGATESYRHYLIDDIGRALAGARALRERLAAHDLDGARRAWVAARIAWERSEVRGAPLRARPVG
jgi:iron uptake system EfeUOB component EfeO/EfeM